MIGAVATQIGDVMPSMPRAYPTSRGEQIGRTPSHRRLSLRYGDNCIWRKVVKQCASPATGDCLLPHHPMSYQRRLVV